MSRRRCGFSASSAFWDIYYLSIKAERWIFFGEQLDDAITENALRGERVGSELLSPPPGIEPRERGGRLRVGKYA